MTDQTARTPYCHKIRYGITGAPELPGREGSYAPEITIAPRVIEFVYSVAREGQPARVDAAVKGPWMRDGERVLPDREITHHYAHGPEGWPGWLVEEARLHDPAVPAPATDQTALRDRIAEALYEARKNGLGGMSESAAVTYMANAVARKLPATVGRAAVLREAADAGEDVANRIHAAGDDHRAGGAYDVVDALRRLAEAQQDGPPPVHLGGQANAELCPACKVERRSLPYPFLCPAETGAVAREARQEPTQDGAREPDPDCERCDGSGLDPDAFFREGDVWTHAPCSECLPEDDAPEPAERVKHSGPDTKFCVLCLSGEHERVDADTAAQSGQPETDEELVHVGWWCWRGDNHGHLAAMACRSDNVPIHVPTEWADEMRAVIQRIEDGDEAETDEEASRG